MTQETKAFDAEVGKILHLMIHSLYENKEIFIRELISNSSDACDKLRYLSQTEPALLEGDGNFKITIHVDKDKKTITIRDNGIGMTKSELIENLGTIAKSGTQNFLSSLSGDAKKDSMLIGQFGVGFYSSFMVADSVHVTTRKAGENNVYSWVSDGLGQYTVSGSDRIFNRGTEILLHIKPEEEEFLDNFRLKHIVKSYSDHLAIPIYFMDADGNNEIKLNSASALWTRPKSEISKEQYQELYKSLSYSADEPWLTIHNKNEGAIEYTNLLFIPSTKTFDLFHPDRKRRVKLYIKRVFISDENIDLIPHYLRFLRGVVDSEDLPLNISRETLQRNSTLSKIKHSITKRVINELKKKKEESIEAYVNFWNNFGSVFKEGLCEPLTQHDEILEACLFHSALKGKFISLDDYIANCKPEQKAIYYLSGDDKEKLLTSPQIEGFLSKGIDVLLFTDTVDDFWVNVNSQYKEFELKSVTRSDINLENIEGTESNGETKSKNEKEAATQEEHTKLIEFFKNILGEAVQDVKISKKLISSPACLAVGDGAMDMRMERFLIEQKQLAISSAKILELNPNHPIIKKIVDNLEKNDTNDNHITKQLAELIFDQACIIEGEPIHDVAGFSKRFSEILQKAVI